jgi:hypothetical protein
MEQEDDRTHMLQMATGYWVSKALYCAAKFRWADHIHAGNHSVNEIAAASQTVPELAHRILRALASVGIFEETESGKFDLTPKAEYLRGDHPQSIRDFAHMAGWDLFEAWVHLDATVQGDAPAIFKAFGENYFREIGNDPEKVRLFDGAMQAIHGGETAFILENYDFSAHRSFMDVGGGNGSNLYGFLQHYREARGILFDLPAVVSGAQATLSSDEVTSRIEFTPGDFFVAVPGQSDAILMRHIIHDWDDERSTMILNHAKKALQPDGKIYLIEKIIAPGNDPGFEKLLDLNMMVIGGKERTAGEYEHLAAAADLRVAEMKVLPGPVDVICMET